MDKLSADWIGSISHGTMRSEDLVPRFIYVLAQADPKDPIVTEWEDVEDGLRALANFMGLTSKQVAEDLGFWDSENMSEFLNEDLFEALNAIAPEGTYFGSSEGDGADYGFWTDPEQTGADYEEGMYPECEQCGHAPHSTVCQRTDPVMSQDRKSYTDDQDRVSYVPVFDTVVCGCEHNV